MQHTLISSKYVLKVVSMKVQASISFLDPAYGYDYALQNVPTDNAGNPLFGKTPAIYVPTRFDRPFIPIGIVTLGSGYIDKPQYVAKPIELRPVGMPAIDTFFYEVDLDATKRMFRSGFTGSGFGRMFDVGQTEYSPDCFLDAGIYSFASGYDYTVDLLYLEKLDS
jgi:hypothetical protein